MDKDYEINEQDIERTIRFLKTIDPENATPEMAISLLEDLQAGVHKLSHDNPELLESLYKELSDDK